MSRPTGPDAEALRTKIETRLRRMPAERRALEASMMAIDVDFDLQRFVDAYNSHREEDINRVRALERNFEVIHNFIVEIARLGLQLDGTRARRDDANAKRDVDELRRRGVLSRRQLETIVSVHDVRSGLQHWYPEMLGPDIHRATTDLLAELGGITRALDEWIESIP